MKRLFNGAIKNRGTTFNGIRGKLVAFNNFLLENVKRMYQIEIPNAEIIWAWQGHKVENKWFYVIEGKFAIVWVEIDDFENPSTDLTSEYKVFEVSGNVVLHIPRGFANELKPLKPNSRGLVLSDLSLVDAENYNYKIQ